MNDEVYAVSEQVCKIMEELRKMCNSPVEAILVLLVCLHEIAMLNDTSPEEAIEEYKKMFLSIEKVYENKLN
jgi:hypothetical protein